MTDAERLYALAIAVFRAADDPERVRQLADLMATIASDLMDREAGVVAMTAPTGKPTPAAISRCGRRAPQ